MVTAVKDVERKVTSVGNSLGVTFPAEVLAHLKLKKGDKIAFDLGDGVVKIQKARKKAPSLPKGIDDEFLDMMGEMMEKYDETFKGLAKR
ncbi:transcriptional regulator [Bacillus infantis]|uniref:AbrB/MazE/SpoVT family DNA-binding domain-containing protein n=1 Tax=Bacillus infantis TaxID=324767 RepID=UPI001CD6B614|nr:transcriptional regulator [Bacillus infantis]MCA1037506.1 transcriptional regulator [Bacillus infantis]